MVKVSHRQVNEGIGSGHLGGVAILGHPTRLVSKAILRESAAYDIPTE